ncbi:anti-sigma factor domain-containing protein [Rhizobium sp. SGZ-381]|uniref:anti-sigma factor n=1 Tax=Rhizobium sp. SGZ-381 TaxID=3342800 RepID=UPI003670D277
MSNPDQSEGDRARDEVLAGEYVLGVLSAESRARVEARIRRDRPFAAIVARWEENLSPLNDEYEAIAPPDFILPMVERRVLATRRRALASRTSTFAGLWGSLAFWRTLALASIFLFAGTMFFTFVAPLPGAPDAGRSGQRQPAPLRPLAELAGQNNAVSLIARYSAGDGLLRLTPVATAGDQPHSLELWVIDGNDPAVSLGILPQSGEGELAVPQALRPKLKDGVTLAVSLEPYGGSPSGAPTGPVLALGKAQMP